MGMVKKIHEISALFAIFEIQESELAKGVLLSHHLQKHQGELADCISHTYTKWFVSVLWFSSRHPNELTKLNTVSLDLTEMETEARR